MDSPWIKLLYFFTDLVLPVCVGWSMRRRGVSSKESLERVMKANLFLLAPLLTGLSFWKVEVAWRLAWLPVLGSMMQLVPGGIAFLRVRKKFDDPLEQGGYILSTMFSNRSVIGVLSVFILLGEQGYAYSRLTMLFGPAMFYMVGFPLAQYFHRIGTNDPTSERPSLASVFLTKNQLPVLGLLVGIALNRWGPVRPDAVDPVFPMLVHVSAWLFLVPVGYDLDLGEMRSYWIRVADILPIKFVVTPAVVAAAAWAVGLEGAQWTTALVLSFTPAAVGAVIAAKLNGLNVHLPMAAYVLTSVAYLAVVFPVLLLFLG